MEKFNERLQKLIDSLGISVNAFAREIGCNEGTIRKILSQNTALGSDKIAKISEKYPEFSVDWLISGRGSMYYDNSANNNYTSQNNDCQEVIKLYERLLEERENRISDLENRIKNQVSKIDILVDSYTKVIDSVVLKSRTTGQ